MQFMRTLAASWVLNLYTTEVWRFHVKMEKSGTNKSNSSQLHSFTSWLSPFSFSTTLKNSLRGGLTVLWALFPKNVWAPARLQEYWGGSYKSFRNSKEFAACLISLIKAGSWGRAVLSETSTGRGPKAMIPVRFGDYSGSCPASQFWWSCCQSSQSSIYIQNAFLVQPTLRGVRKQISATSPCGAEFQKRGKQTAWISYDCPKSSPNPIKNHPSLKHMKKPPHKPHCLLAILLPLLKDQSIFCKSTRAALRKELNCILNSPQATLGSVICYRLADRWCLCQRMTQSSHTNQNQSNF